MTASTDRERALEQDVFDEWPPALRAAFDGTSLETKIGFTASLVTRDVNGHLRTSLLGVGELYAPDSRTLCLALWPQSRAARALREGGRAALTFVFDDAFYQVQLDIQPLPNTGGGLACFTGSIDTGEAQRVPYARLTGGISFDLEENRDAVLDRWKQQIEHLKKTAGASPGR
ncbi:hypothetical protein [Paraburkholderia saeva]|uniref:Uncharacterized protein n=1 Tax=Paraburkholderia saeva TaxID=2777537 RepID=A0A9N8RTW6_9BURK|nr:hypothetical protein [Paraburkholderia saeva]CAG4890697.1 hypothetical protein LMG31841_01193 [Paraburkholderia saeva]CAG4893872.1 hypothetical protein R52603_01677 [Paraburkholderia saeva]CAG4914171.1 hypothetical protein R70241_04208 [Paraburkholderia saeva]